MHVAKNAKPRQLPRFFCALNLSMLSQHPLIATVSISLEYDSAAEVDEVCARAAKLGAKIETQPTDSFWGTRYASLKDPFGHRWVLNAPLQS